MDELVQKLSIGNHPVVTQRDQSAGELKESIDRGYVLVTFTDTRGKTELGISLNEKLTNLDNADFDNVSGAVHLVGDLTLNYIKVRCVADISLSTQQGNGHLEILKEE